MYNVSEAADIHLIAPVRRVGNSLAVIIPAEEARRVGLVEGSIVELDVRPTLPPLLGMLKGRAAKTPFRREKDHDDRI